MVVFLTLSGERPRPRLSKSFPIHNWSYFHLVRCLEFIGYWITELSAGPWCDTPNLAVRSGNIIQVLTYLLLIRKVLGFNICHETGCPKLSCSFLQLLALFRGRIKTYNIGFHSSLPEIFDGLVSNSALCNLFSRKALLNKKVSALRGSWKTLPDVGRSPV
jgi:hypothetical protein